MSKVQNHKTFDLLILGSGISGATLFNIASNTHKKVLLIDKNDFASGTSQSSGMMIWGGVLYLKNLNIKSVLNFSKARDELIKHSNQVVTRRFNFAFLKKGGRSIVLVRFALYIYRLLGFLRRSENKRIKNSHLPKSWNYQKFNGGISYEEGFLKKSDTDYTIQWLLNVKNNESEIYNYTTVESITWHKDLNVFKVRYTDYNKINHIVYSKTIVNTCGVWADSVNTQFGIQTKYSHFLSKGVYLLLDNKTQEKDAFIVDMEQYGDTLSWVPWGETIMWGPTETNISSVSERIATKEDVVFLLNKLNVKSKKNFDFKDVINVRVGIRPLAIKSNKQVNYSLDLSRKAILEKNENLPWFTVFGGKLSGGVYFSKKVFKKIFKAKPNKVLYHSFQKIPTTTAFYNHRELPDVKWCVRHTQVRCLEDYTRRRTNIAQWVPLGGMGFNHEYVDDLKKICLLIHGSAKAASLDFNQYKDKQLKERSHWED